MSTTTASTLQEDCQSITDIDIDHVIFTKIASKNEAAKNSALTVEEVPIRADHANTL